MLDDNFVIGYEAFIKSFLHNNSWFDYDFVILDVGLSDNSRDVICSYYDKIKFIKPNKGNYRDVNFNKTHEKLRNTYYTLDVFNQTDYDRIVFIDMDTVVLDDISELFQFEGGFGAVKSYNAKFDELNDSINSGVFVVNKQYINERTYYDLIRVARPGYSMPDQKTINKFFRGKMEFFNKSYNVEKRMLHTKKYKHILDKIKILHFVSSKPWQQEKPNDIERSFGEFEKIWWNWYNF